jgi:hypothetical protein
MRAPRERHHVAALSGTDAMGTESEGFFASVTSRYAMARDFLTRASTLISQVTFNIKGATPQEAIAELGQRWKITDSQRGVLRELAASKEGAAFIGEKIQGMNRGAFHRSAFALNAFTQLGFVDLAAQLSMTLPQLKWALVAANLLLAWIAHDSIRQNYKALLAGPNALPPKRRFWGLAPNPAYNRAVKKSSLTHARSAWQEKSIYRPAYFFNAITIFVGSQFIIPPGQLIFPFGLILGKVTGLFSTAVMVFDAWRGIRAGDDARAAREREISIYRHLDI